MPDLFCELLSEEIPARLQAGAAADLARLAGAALAPLSPADVRTWWGPRRIAMAMRVAAEVPASARRERGPRLTAPEAALAGFLRKHGAAREALVQEGDFWVLELAAPARPAAALIAEVLPALLWRFPWPKSMRWGTSAFLWVRPLRRICCVLDGAVVPFRLGTEADDAHGLVAGGESEGHRFMAPGAFAVAAADDWLARLRAARVIASAEERERMIAAGIAARAAEVDAVVVEDAGLLREVAGLVEWPVCLRGAIDAAFMDLPPEVMQVSMRVNQRYFALRQPDGRAAPWFAFAANVEAADGGAAIVAGNERVLRARFADARHFWDADRKRRLADRVDALSYVSFHDKLGSQYERAAAIADIARAVAIYIDADEALAKRAGALAKADLTSGMVGEFPELQGIMGGYYAAHDGEAPAVAAAIRDHYQPKGPGDTVPTAPLSIAVALADKLDQLVAFFSIGERPTGSGDPFALRRAALGIIRIVRENALRLPLREVLQTAALRRVATLLHASGPIPLVEEIFAFVVERLRVQLRDEGARPDILQAVFAVAADDDINRLLARTEALADLLATEDGANLLAGYRRAANILRIEDRKDGPHTGTIDAALLAQPEERDLHEALRTADFAGLLAQEEFTAAMQRLAALRPALDAFFDRVTVNTPEHELRRNRLRLLAAVRDTVHRIADLSLVASGGQGALPPGPPLGPGAPDPVLLES